MLVLPHFARCPPHRRRTVLTLLLPDWSSDAEYAYSYKELDTVNKALLEAQAADNAEIAARLANGFPEYAKRPPSHVQRYVADRERLLADREEVGLPCLDCEQY